MERGDKKGKNIKERNKTIHTWLERERERQCTKEK
jgi:hypothetical protein